MICIDYTLYIAGTTQDGQTKLKAKRFQLVRNMGNVYLYNPCVISLSLLINIVVVLNIGYTLYSVMSNTWE